MKNKIILFLFVFFSTSVFASERENAFKALAEVDIATMVLALQSLSSQQRAALPPHIEFYESGSDVVSAATKSIQRVFVKKNFIVPVAQARKTEHLNYTEIRYYDKKALDSAILIQSLLVELNIHDSKIVYVEATENYQRFYGEDEMYNHFEISLPTQ